MNITGADFCRKLREIIPNLPSGITPEVLKRTCDDPTTQSFLGWFCKNVGRENFLSTDDLRLEKYIKEKGEWLEGEKLDAALADATKDCPKLLELLDLESSIPTRLSDALEAEKIAHKEDIDYIEMLEENQRTLKQLLIKLDDETETQEAELEKEHIKVNKLYQDCIAALDEFDSVHRQFFGDIETLLEVYADAVEKKDTIVAWTQVPLDAFVKQMELHNDYLGIYIKRHFGGTVEQDNNSDYETLIDSGRERCEDERVYELLKRQTEIITSKTDEINAKVKESACAAMAAHAIEIYNSNGSMIPQTESQLRTEIATLTRKRDFLEENIELIRNKELKEVVRQYAKLKITKILIDDGHVRADKTRNRLEKLENLRTLAREKGHGHSDLLHMLMQLQLQRLKEIVEFIADGRHYLATEYSLSSLRTERMRQQQTEFEAIQKAPPNKQNVFTKILISLLFGNNAEINDLDVATSRYDALVEENERNRADVLGIQMDRRIAGLNKLHNEVTSIYDAEMKGPTKSFKVMSHEVTTRLDHSTRSVSDIQDSVKQIRTKLKEMSRTTESSFERDTTIMWQRFLANPAALVSKYDEIKRKIESSHFSDTSNV